MIKIISNSLLIKVLVLCSLYCGTSRLNIQNQNTESHGKVSLLDQRTIYNGNTAYAKACENKHRFHRLNDLKAGGRVPDGEGTITRFREYQASLNKLIGKKFVASGKFECGFPVGNFKVEFIDGLEKGFTYYGQVDTSLNFQGKGVLFQTPYNHAFFEGRFVEGSPEGEGGLRIRNWDILKSVSESNRSLIEEYKSLKTYALTDYWIGWNHKSGRTIFELIKGLDSDYQSLAKQLGTPFSVDMIDSERRIGGYRELYLQYPKTLAKLTQSHGVSDVKEAYRSALALHRKLKNKADSEELLMVWSSVAWLDRHQIDILELILKRGYYISSGLSAREYRQRIARLKKRRKHFLDAVGAQFMEAAQEGNIPKALKLFEAATGMSATGSHTPELDHSNDKGETPIMKAIEYKQFVFVKKFYTGESGMARDKGGETPLMKAVKARHIPLVQFILSKDQAYQFVLTKNKKGQTAKDLAKSIPNKVGKKIYSLVALAERNIRKSNQNFKTRETKQQIAEKAKTCANFEWEMAGIVNGNICKAVEAKRIRKGVWRVIGKCPDNTTTGLKVFRKNRTYSTRSKNCGSL